MMLRHLALIALCVAAAGQRAFFVQEVNAVELTDADLTPAEEGGVPHIAAEGERTALAAMDTPTEPPTKVQGYSVYLRWIWWLVVLYCFWAQAEVCDEFFVPTIEVIVDTFSIPQDVAGATIMALGCNGPELFLNTISIFNHSDIGIGAVIGGEVFNVLVLVGCSLIATPNIYMPLRLAKFSYSRDVIWYAFSIAALYVVLRDNRVYWYEGLGLFICGLCYSTFVAFSGRMRKKLGGKKDVQQKEGTLAPTVTADASETIGSYVPEVMAQPGPKTGMALGIRVQLDNRMLDRGRHWDTRFVTMGASGLLVSTEVQPSNEGRTARGIVYQHDNKGGAWRHAGIVNVPSTLDEERQTRPPVSYTDDDAGTPRSNPESGLIVDKDVPMEVIPRRDFVSCVPPDDPSSTCFELHVVQRNDYFGKLIRIEFDCKSARMRERWQAAVISAMTEALRDLANVSTDPSAIRRPPSFIPNGTVGGGMSNNQPSCGREWLDWLCFPVRSMLKATIPDVHKPHLRKWYPFSFAMCMGWLAVFAFVVIEVCEILHEEFGISNGILGFTVAAIGTSFPNVVSCVAVSKQGRTAMAVANSLGANIQNVFLALALPWIVQASITDNGDGRKGYFEPGVNALVNSVLWMFGTLGLMVVIVMGARCRMPKWSGYVFLVTYAVFLTFQLGVEVSHNDCWPFNVPSCSI